MLASYGSKHKMTTSLLLVSRNLRIVSKKIYFLNILTMHKNHKFYSMQCVHRCQRESSFVAHSTCIIRSCAVLVLWLYWVHYDSTVAMYSPTKWMPLDFSDCNWDKLYELCTELEANVLSWRKFRPAEVLLKNLFYSSKPSLKK